MTGADTARILADEKTEADMSLTPADRDAAMVDIAEHTPGDYHGHIGTTVPGLTGTVRRMADPYPLIGLVPSERVDAATMDLPDDPARWTDEEVHSVRAAIGELMNYCLRAEAAHHPVRTSSLSADPDAYRYDPANR